METMTIPKQFIWVIVEWIKWHENCSVTGDFVIKYKDGGICGVLKNEYIKPPKK